MSTTNEAFLFRVIEHSNNGSVDWQKVGDIFGIKKNAAYMRFDRDAAGTSSAGDKSADGDDQPETPKKATKKTPKKTPAKKGTPNKKRKIDDEGSGDGAEEQSPVKGEPEDEDFQ
ncbi:hypothetical protein LTR97_001692 [Elasticomyces elasticus]|uniref:Myb-like DNA-binding domain-containing protein n=1 Tax=Elasticomyces elasticus TaxID=574655 RepID=A0AAN7WQP6_9PEZI|nr:hypothetical protein LTR97_001692 [Elasticomyces elasticus]